ncbi:unnamed protein product [Prunus armeniaca]
MFIKFDISGGGKFLGFKIKDTITFLAKGITNKNATPSSFIKFVNGVCICGIAKATKNTHVRISRRVVMKHDIWGVVREERCR